MKKLALTVLALVCTLAVPASAAKPPIGASQDRWPTFSPDGRWVAFTRVSGKSTLFTLEVAPARGGRVVQLAQARWQLQPSWSPDSAEIAYQSGGDVYVTDLAGARRRVGRGTSPAYGRHIARVVDTTLYVGSRPWSTKVFGRPAWSPDGNRIAFQRVDGIYVSDGTTESKWATTVLEPGSPFWSPDGSRIAYVANDTVYVASPGIAPPQAVTPFVHDMGDPSWSRAGDALVNTSRWGVVLWRLSGTHTVLHAASGTGAAFSPKADVVAYAGRRPGCPDHIGIVVAAPISGSCAVTGTPGADVIYGTQSWGDAIAAGAGNDRVHANDGHTDRVDCGPGRDTVWADKLDKLTHCEVVHR